MMYIQKRTYGRLTRTLVTLISVFHHLFKRSIQDEVSIKYKQNYPKFYSDFVMENGRFTCSNTLFEKKYYYPVEDDVFISGIIKNYHLGDLIYNNTKKILSAFSELFNLVSTRVSEIEKTLRKVRQINRFKTNFKLRLTQFRDSKLNLNMMKLIADENESIATSSQINSNKINDTKSKNEKIRNTKSFKSEFSSTNFDRNESAFSSNTSIDKKTESGKNSSWTGETLVNYAINNSESKPSQSSTIRSRLPNTEVIEQLSSPGSELSDASEAIRMKKLIKNKRR